MSNKYQRAARGPRFGSRTLCRPDVAVAAAVGGRRGSAAVRALEAATAVQRNLGGVPGSQLRANNLAFPRRPFDQQRRTVARDSRSMTLASALSGGTAPSPVVFVPGGSLPPWEEGAGSPQAPTYEAPQTSPIFVRAEPIPLSEPQGTGWRPMHNPASWLSQPHPDNPPINTDPSSYAFPGGRPPPPPITAPPSFPQVPQGPTAHRGWGSSIPPTPRYTVPPQTNTLPQLPNDIPPVRTSSPTAPSENTVPQPVSATDPATEGLPDTTQATAATDATVSFSVNTVPEGHENMHQQNSVTPSSTSSGSSPLRVPGGVLDHKNVHQGSVPADATVGGSVTVTPNETSTPVTVDRDSPNIESPDYPLAGGAVAGIVIGSIASVALLAGKYCYDVKSSSDCLLHIFKQGNSGSVALSDK
ncbi:hypothetical protein HPB50_019774 [Hyalomma asiaticum]|uniref:Uncharacterized protein n=1 Tax=Hyalomma asiaticum TaxID=266040 RepID=A0ACB7SS44_HYAAI|nr:hypothetical protein HPB50_019774 [Hyalomma asiaticum]